MIKQYLQYIPEHLHEEFLSAFSYQTVNILNEALQQDPRAMESLLSIRMACEPTLSTNFIVTQHSEKSYSIGIMGIINGLLPTTKHVMPVYFTLPDSASKTTNSLSLFCIKDTEYHDKDNEESQD